MSRFDNCPHCGSSQFDSVIPNRNRCQWFCEDEWDKRSVNCKENHHYGKSSEFFYRTISVEVRGVYDGCLYYQCPDCDGTWHREWGIHGKESMKEKAAPFIHGPQRNTVDEDASLLILKRMQQGHRIEDIEKMRDFFDGTLAQGASATTADGTQHKALLMKGNREYVVQRRYLNSISETCEVVYSGGSLRCAIDAYNLLS